MVVLQTPFLCFLKALKQKDRINVEELKIPRWQHSAGSIPALGTIFLSSNIKHARLSSLPITPECKIKSFFQDQQGYQILQGLKIQVP